MSSLPSFPGSFLVFPVRLLLMLDLLKKGLKKIQLIFFYKYNKYWMVITKSKKATSPCEVESSVCHSLVWYKRYSDTFSSSIYIYIFQMTTVFEREEATRFNFFYLQTVDDIVLDKRSTVAVIWDYIVTRRIHRNTLNYLSYYPVLHFIVFNARI